jgi:hypothetical protein
VPALWAVPVVPALRLPSGNSELRATNNVARGDELMATEPLHIRSHRDLQALEDYVEAKFPVSHVRLEWMDPDREPFEIKAFALRQLKGLHAGLCLQHIHAPSVPQKGTFGSACAYCGYGHGESGVTVVAKAEEFGVSV